MSIRSHVIRLASRNHHAQLAEVLVEAFQLDPLAIWLFPDPAERRRNHRILFEKSLSQPGDRAVIDMSETCDGVAIWRPVDLPLDGSVPAGASAAAADWFSRIADAAPSPPYWNLAFIGATVRGGGVGGALMRHRLALLSGSVALWTANEANLRFYERFGFQVASKVDLPDVSAWWLTR